VDGVWEKHALQVLRATRFTPLAEAALRRSEDAVSVCAAANARDPFVRRIVELSPDLFEFNDRLVSM
jgi:hypothetical protein